MGGEGRQGRWVEKGDRGDGWCQKGDRGDGGEGRQGRWGEKGDRGDGWYQGEFWRWEEKGSVGGGQMGGVRMETGCVAEALGEKTSGVGGREMDGPGVRTSLRPATLPSPLIQMSHASSLR